MSEGKSKPSPCPDCGSTQVNHLFTYISVYLEHLGSRKSRWAKNVEHYLAPKLAPSLSLALLSTFQVLNWLGVVRKLLTPDSLTSDRSRVFWEAAQKRGLQMWEYRFLGMRLNTYGLRARSQTYIFNSLLLPSETWQSESAFWMDDKALMREKFKEAGIPIAGGRVVKNTKEARLAYSNLVKPLITKPSEGSRSRHTTTHIETEEDLVKGFKKANMLSPWVIIEEELVGAVYRITLVGNKVIAVCYRGVAEVTGDGTHSVEELVNEENKKPLRKGPHFHELPTRESGDLVAKSELERQGLTWDSIPPKGQLVTLGTKTSRGAGGSIIDVTENVHPENWDLFEKIGQYLNDPLVGIDFIIGDISKPWHAQERSGVIECNGMPFIDLHHYPLEGPARDVASTLLELNFPYLRDQSSLRAQSNLPKV
jgi:D-alanine-D-alanine ligase-like ATP-grasp enzyme